MNQLCELCPRMCHVDRSKHRGFCKEGINPRIALVSLHHWEEPCLVGKNGAGTIFFSGCSLGCIYCQNQQIINEGFGIEVTTKRLAEIFIEQQNRHATNLDLVTPTHFADKIIDALDMVKDQLTIPIVYNSSGYENLMTLEKLRSYVDIFLPDLKYFDESIASEYSNAQNYFQVATQAIKKMFDIVGKIQMKNEILQRGLIIRHLILPNHRKDSLKIVEWIAKNFSDNVILSLMRQYTPTPNVPKKIARTVTTFEYESVVNYAIDCGIKNIYVQEKESASNKFIPIFNGKNVIL